MLDALGCEAWADSLSALGFDVSVHVRQLTRGSEHERHLSMRRFTQGIVPAGPLLLLEDDTIVPPGVYAALKRAKRGHRAATGVQVSRHGSLRAWGVWKGLRTLRTGESPADACGHYCLLTTGADYRLPILPGKLPPASAIDYAHTRQLAPIGVAWDAVCGHLTKRRVLMEAKHVVGYTDKGGVQRVSEQSVRLSDGTVHWYDPEKHHDDPFTGDGKLIKEAPMIQAGGETYRVKERVVGGGIVLAGPKRRIPIETAREWARLGYINDPELFDPRDAVKPAPPLELKAKRVRAKKKAAKK